MAVSRAKQTLLCWQLRLQQVTCLHTLRTMYATRSGKVYKPNPYDQVLLPVSTCAVGVWQSAPATHLHGRRRGGGDWMSLSPQWVAKGSDISCHLHREKFATSEPAMAATQQCSCCLQLLQNPRRGRCTQRVTLVLTGCTHVKQVFHGQCLACQRAIRVGLQPELQDEGIGGVCSCMQYQHVSRLQHPMTSPGMRRALNLLTVRAPW